MIFLKIGICQHNRIKLKKHEGLIPGSGYQFYMRSLMKYGHRKSESRIFI